MKALSRRLRWAAVFGLLAATSLQAGLVRQCNLATLTRQAQTIVRGRCVGVVSVSEPNDAPLPYIEYTLEVEEALKGCRDEEGKVLRRIVFRHVADRPARELPDGTRVVPLRFGLPRYKKGEEIVLFLTGESHLGLCSPVGLTQGVFRIRRQDDKATLQNDCLNRGLFSKMTAADLAGDAGGELRQLQTLSGPIELTRFLHLCRSLRQ